MKASVAGFDLVRSSTNTKLLFSSCKLSFYQQSVTGSARLATKHGVYGHPGKARMAANPRAHGRCGSRSLGQKYGIWNEESIEGIQKGLHDMCRPASAPCQSEDTAAVTPTPKHALADRENLQKRMLRQSAPTKHLSDFGGSRRRSELLLQRWHVHGVGRRHPLWCEGWGRPSSRARTARCQCKRRADLRG